MNLSAFVDYYVLLSITNKKPEFGNKAQERLYYQAQEALDDLSANLSRAIWDYLFMASFGEGRHAQTYGGSYYFDEYNEYTARNGRGSAYAVSIEFDPENNFPILQDLFESWSSGGGFGGKKWAKITEIAQMYNIMPANLYIDLVASVQHNGGLAFDKGEVENFLDLDLDISCSKLVRLFQFIFLCRDFPSIVGVKALEWNDENNITDILSSFLSKKVYFLWNRFNTIYGVDTTFFDKIDMSENCSPAFIEKISYNPQTWGKHILSDVIIKGQENDSDSDSDNDSDQDYKLHNEKYSSYEKSIANYNFEGRQE